MRERETGGHTNKHKDGHTYMTDKHTKHRQTHTTDTYTDRKRKIVDCFIINYSFNIVGQSKKCFKEHILRKIGRLFIK